MHSKIAALHKYIRRTPIIAIAAALTIIAVLTYKHEKHEDRLQKQCLAYLKAIGGMTDGGAILAHDKDRIQSHYLLPAIKMYKLTEDHEAYCYVPEQPKVTEIEREDLKERKPHGQQPSQKQKEREEGNPYNKFD